MAADHLATKLFKEEPENFKHGVRRGSVLHPPVVISPYHPYHLQSSLILEHIEVMGIVQRNGYWWMQDRATSHTTLEVLWFFLDKFCGRVISRRSEIIWAPYRPDLNILIYFLWLYATMQVQRRKPTTIKKLKKTVEDIMRTILEEMVWDAVANIHMRCRANKAAPGGHFKSFLKQF